MNGLRTGIVRPRLYSPAASVRLWRAAAARLPAAGALALGLACGGCSLSWQLDTLFGKDSANETATTASITPPPGAKPAEVLPPEHDLAYTRAAAEEVLARGGKDSSLPWENPKTGARGTVTPIATAYTHNGATCRDFLASYVYSGVESWLQGEACQANRGRWQIRHLKPWKRT
ncbi:MAG: RT0821/Lpp0805 family surface protein [Pseudolabrys sp.]